MAGKPGVASLPVAERIVAAAPFASLKHLPAVPGVGPGGLARIEAAEWACLRLPASPPPVFDLCRGLATDIDLNTISVSAASDLFGRPTAERLQQLQARPMWKVEHALTLAGVGPGRVDKYRERLCVTPPTFHDPDSAVSWTWASDGEGVIAQSQDGRSSIVVPDPAIQRSLWVRIENLVGSGRVADSPEWSPALEAQLPRALFAPAAYDTDLVLTDGAQVQPAAPVRVTLPVDPDLVAADLVPIVRHWDEAFGDWEVYKRRAEHNPVEGTVSAWVTHLSASFASFTTVAPLVVFPDDGSSQTNEVSMLDVMTRSTSPTNDTDPACGGLDPHTDDARRGNALVERTSNDGAFSYCTYFDGNFATWKVRNTRSAPVKVTINSQHGWVRADGTSADEVLTRALLDYTGTRAGQWTQRGVWLAPGDVASVQLRHHTQATITLDGEAGPVWGYAGSIAILDMLGASRDSKAAELHYIASCAYSADLFACIVGIEIDKLMQVLAEKGLARYVGTVAAKRALLAIQALEVLNAAGALSAETLRVRFDRPPKPSVDSRGRTIPDNCVREWSDTSWSWPVDAGCVDAANPVPADQPNDGGTQQPPTSAYIIKRTGSSASYVIDDARVAHHIPDGGTYLCNAARLPVRYQTDDAEWATLVASQGNDATCPSGAARGLYPDTVRNFLLRTSGGDVYYVGTDGFRIRLFSGDEVFACMADRYLVWDFVTDTELNRFHPHPSLVATGCGVQTQ